ncbi:alpha-hydroxy acid oxidase [Sediminivirga luteola]|uniref:Alpha-hydroxy-acid oxidizing enzyme n=1 Tax=Sediminivirga luteola TaxID=1774748 RepID=A0A8J2TVJ2_9MICO|nr:alpha-hydroxy acid oxidase [Sediminivirga luteola]MCI2265301.1 alpha-hydroxy-acid oxidizing protein [Sediminivirga luteola]GGA04535.1 alpha-hydroxy-acid oxidizing enzyme [Sediminivirga luteola]
MRRQLPEWHQLRPLLQFKRPDLNRRRARVAAAADVWDLRRIAKRRTPKAPFDYTDGAAELELGLAKARAAFQAVEFKPGVLRNVAQIDLGTTIAGGFSELPFGIAPTGFTRMMHAEGEVAGVQAAAAAGIPFTLSTMGTTSVEDVAAAAPGSRRWFQLYLWKDREKSRAIVDRAAAAGFDTLMVTVDTAVAGARLRDVRNGMTIPPSLTLKTVLDASYRPEWWYNFLSTEPLTFASLSSYTGTVGELINEMFDPTLEFSDLEWLRQQWPGKLFVKGIQTADDAAAVVASGADGVVLSNHGGRQLDRAPVPLHTIPEVRERVGRDTEIIVDTGIMNGGDVIAAIAAGADFALVGRAYLYGLMAGGRLGVDRVIELLAQEAARTMALIGVTSLKDLTPEHVTLHRPAPLARLPR